MTIGPSINVSVHRRGRAIGIALFAGIVTTFTAVCSVEIIYQAWQPPVPPVSTECRTGIRALVTAIRRARRAATAATGGERETVGGFQAALQPEWSMRPGLTGRCAGDELATRALSDVDRLRYAEERSVRYEALDVTERRRIVADIEKKLGEPR